MYSIQVNLTGNNADVNPADYVNNTSFVYSVNGKIGDVVVSVDDLGLSLVDNTPDLEKPLSNPTRLALEDLESRLSNGLDISKIDFNFYPNSGTESAFIGFPRENFSKPKSVVCEIENNIDNVIYNHSISNVSDSGFYLNFSDFLSQEGYVVHVSASF